MTENSREFTPVVMGMEHLPSEIELVEAARHIDHHPVIVVGDDQEAKEAAAHLLPKIQQYYFEAPTTYKAPFGSTISVARSEAKAKRARLTRKKKRNHKRK